jgi:hypothetical protein
MKASLETPVLFLIFNRPDTTEKVFKEIKKAKPKQLFVAADAPREGVEGEKEKCKKTKEVVAEIDWDCEVKRLYRDKNLGCKKAVNGAIDWFFENVEQGIILEDDCLPNQSFFIFCQQMLRRYKDDKRIMQVTGTNLSSEYNRDPDYSYYFSQYGSIWGWATWKRAWKLQDLEMQKFKEIYDKNYFEDIFRTDLEKKNRIENYKKCYNNGMNAWDYQWSFAKVINNGLIIVPKKNLIKNIGFGEEATHTKKISNKHIKENEEIKFPLDHPDFLFVDRKQDLYQVEKFFSSNKFKTLLKKIIDYFK